MTEDTRNTDIQLGEAKSEPKVISSDVAPPDLASGFDPTSNEEPTDNEEPTEEEKKVMKSALALYRANKEKPTAGLTVAPYTGEIANTASMGTWFGNLEKVAYSFIEYIPFVGSVYSFKRAHIAYSEHNWKAHWASVANFVESVVRDIVLFNEWVEPLPAVLIHTMGESFTDTLADMYSDHHIATGARIKAKIVDKTAQYVVIGGTQAHTRSKEIVEKFFKDRMIGLHHFHSTRFEGTIKHKKYAMNGEKMVLVLPDGIVDRGRCHFVWYWSVDYWGTIHSPAYVYGRIRLDKPSPAVFVLVDKKGYYDFECTVNSTKEISAKISWQVAGEDVVVTLTRVEPPPKPPKKCCCEEKGFKCDCVEKLGKCPCKKE